MIQDLIIAGAVLTTTLLGTNEARQLSGQSASAVLRGQNQNEQRVLAQHLLDLTTRLPSPSGSGVFADNILLSLHYLKGDSGDPRKIDWEKIRSPFEVSFTLNPGEVFAFHKNVLPEYSDPKHTMNSAFFVEEGYKSLAGLGGNGVCHLASLITWVATQAGLEVKAPARHDFWPVPGVPKIFGTSIRSQQACQNLYIRNSLDQPVTFVFRADNQNVDLKISKNLN